MPESTLLMNSRMSLMIVALFLLLPGVGRAADPSFPLRLSENRRYLVDQKGMPFLYQADTPWMLFTKLTKTEAAEYMAHRKAQGFNVLQVQLTGFLGMSNRAGAFPFAGIPPQQFLNQPQEAFFAHVDEIIQEAKRQKLLLAIAPLWSGCCGEGWAGRTQDKSPAPLNVHGPEAAHRFGTWLGKRYGKFPNILWILGGDNDPHNARREIQALGKGLKESAPHQLITYHAASTHSSTDVWPADESWLDVSMVYTYFRGFNKAWNKIQPDVYEVSHQEFLRIPVRPFFLGESTYEGEHGEWGSALQVRKQAWWCVLSGGFGHAYGSPNWNMPSNWRQLLDLPGAQSMIHLQRFMSSVAWWKLVPDIQNVVAIDGRGPASTNNYAVTALAHDGSFALSYIPSPRTLTVDLSKISGTTIRASWFNPRTGSSTPATTSPITTKAKQSFIPPDENDWVLVLQNARP